MSETQQQKFDKILEALLASIKNRDGADRVERLRSEIKDRAMAGMKREMIFQILSLESGKHRRLFLTLYPELIPAFRHRIPR